ncbi:MAG: ECF-type sigma factor [Acidobacteriota bacterium]|nr:ECF-type sigma factor [Acidobacteriota bacterium]
MSEPDATNEDDFFAALDDKDLDKLVPEVYAELKRLAAYHLHNERPNHTLRPTELVHEVYLLLHRQHSLDLNDRVYFLSVASSIMRRVLVNYAKHRKRKKRGEGRENLPLNALDEKTLIDFEQSEVDVIALEEVLVELAKRDAQAVKIIELHFYGGLTFEEIAQLLDVSLSTVMREWRFARNWLYRNLHGSG